MARQGRLTGVRHCFDCGTVGMHRSVAPGTTPGPRPMARCRERKKDQEQKPFVAGPVPAGGRAFTPGHTRLARTSTARLALWRQTVVGQKNSSNANHGDYAYVSQ